MVDFTCNDYCDILIQFLIDANFCILNGRNFLKNDFTCIRPQGCSVVDYCLVSHDCLNMFTDFSVIRVSDLINLAGVQCLSSIPDHSVLTWKFTFQRPRTETSEDLSKNSSCKYKVDNLPVDFMADEEFIRNIHDCVFKLEASMRSQTDIDDSYQSLCSVIKTEMESKLPCKTISYSQLNNKKRRVGKPWWNDNLTVLWNGACAAEKVWLSCKIHLKKCKLTLDYGAERKSFERALQRSKRKYWYLFYIYRYKDAFL